MNMAGAHNQGLGSTVPYMNKFLDFTVNVWQQQQATENEARKLMNASTEHVHQTLNKKSVELERKSEQLSKIEKENIELKEQVKELGIELRGVRRKLHEQEQISCVLRTVRDRLLNDKRKLIEKHNVACVNEGSPRRKQARVEQERVQQDRVDQDRVDQDRSIWTAIKVLPELEQQSQQVNPQPETRANFSDVSDDEATCECGGACSGRCRQDTQDDVIYVSGKPGPFYNI